RRYRWSPALLRALFVGRAFIGFAVIKDWDLGRCLAPPALSLEHSPVTTSEEAWSRHCRLRTPPLRFSKTSLRSDSPFSSSPAEPAPFNLANNAASLVALTSLSRNPSFRLSWACQCFEHFRLTRGNQFRRRTAQTAG